MTEFLHEVLLDGLIDSLKILPFFFLTYLLMEYLEHRAKDKLAAAIGKPGVLGPAIGGLLGVLPQCGFSAGAAELYGSKLITAGTLAAVFLSTSDEMLPLMISEAIPPLTVLLIVGYKLAVGIAVGLLLDLCLRKIRKAPVSSAAEKPAFGCHCEGGILKSSLLHTLKIGGFVLAVNLIIGSAVFFIGEEKIASLFAAVPALSYLIASLIGLIPNCAASVALTELWLNGLVSVGTMLAGLFPGAGIGIVIFLKGRSSKKEKILFLLLILAVGILAGALADLVLQV